MMSIQRWTTIDNFQFLLSFHGPRPGKTDKRMRENGKKEREREKDREREEGNEEKERKWKKERDRMGKELK